MVASDQMKPRNKKLGRMSPPRPSSRSSSKKEMSPSSRAKFLTYLVFTITISFILFIISINSTSNCQTTTTTRATNTRSHTMSSGRHAKRQAAELEHKRAHLPHARKCDQQAEEDALVQHERSQHNDHYLNQQQQQQQPRLHNYQDPYRPEPFLNRHGALLPERRSGHQAIPQTRQQRQYSARSAAMMAAASEGAAAQQQQQQQQQTAPQQNLALVQPSEEFSLSSLPSVQAAAPASHSQASNAATTESANHNASAVPLGSTNDTAYVMLAAPAQSADVAQRVPQQQPSATSGLGDVPGEGLSISTSTASSTSSTTTESAIPLNTTPAIATNSISSPVAAQAPATTTSSVMSPVVASTTTTTSTASPASSQVTKNSSTGGALPADQPAQRQQAGRRIEDSSSSLSVDRHASNPAGEQDQRHADSPSMTSGKSAQANQQQQQLSTAISSSPSSVSIITPLNGPPSSQQQQQAHSSSASSSSSMIKPLYVLGNPLAELDYTSTAYGSDQQQQQLAQTGKAKVVDASAAGTQQQQNLSPQRTEKRIDEPHQQQQLMDGNHHAIVNNSTRPFPEEGERMNGPALVYSDGHLVANSHQANASSNMQQQQVGTNNGGGAGEPPTHAAQPPHPLNAVSSIAPPSPRLFQGPPPTNTNAGAVLSNSPRRPSLPPPVNQANAASGFRSPMSPSGPLVGQPTSQQQQQQMMQQPPASSGSLMQPVNQVPNMPNFYQTSPPYVGAAGQLFSQSNGGGGGIMNNQLASATTISSLVPSSSALSNKQAYVMSSQRQQQQQQQQQPQIPTQIQIQMQQSQQQQQAPQASITNQQQVAVQTSRRPLNITRVEHISAECSNDLIRAIIVFNGTFKGIIYSSGYVSDPTCLYVNGTGLTRYEFSIRLNQCGTLGRQEVHQPTIPGEARRRDQVMWNTLSIQYNPVIEQEWDEHFRVSCEYGSDFWKTISFSPFNVETNTGAPVVFTINPPQCQMDVLLGHGMGPKIAVDGPVTVGDPLTLLIHMKSEKAGYDILVKNCVAHNGGKQRMQLIDSNGCVVNERFISPFRGTYNDNDLRHVTLYAYLKAFRFTGSPVLYLECEIHMCQSACPPQMCYWRRLSKRSVDNSDFEYTDDRASLGNLTALAEQQQQQQQQQPIISDSLSLFKALQVRHEPIEPAKARRRAQQLQEIYAEDDEAQLVCYRHAEVLVFMTTIGSLLLLVLSVAITCCLRIRKLTRSQFQHSRLAASAAGHKNQKSPCSSSSSSSSLITQSLSPSLLSISDTFSQTTASGNSLTTSAVAVAKANHTRASTLDDLQHTHLSQQQQQQHNHHQLQKHCLAANGLLSPVATLCRGTQQPRPPAKPSQQQIAAALRYNQKPKRPQQTHSLLSPHLTSNNNNNNNNSNNYPTTAAARQFNLNSPTSADIYTSRH